MDKTVATQIQPETEAAMINIFAISVLLTYVDIYIYIYTHIYFISSLLLEFYFPYDCILFCK